MAKNRPKIKPLTQEEYNYNPFTLGMTDPIKDKTSNPKACTTCGCTGGGGWIRGAFGDQPCPSCNSSALYEK